MVVVLLVSLENLQLQGLCRADATLAAMRSWMNSDDLTTVICHVSLEPQPLSIIEFLVTTRQ